MPALDKKAYRWRVFLFSRGGQEKEKQRKLEGNGIKLEDLLDDHYVVLFEIIHWFYKCLLFNTSYLLGTVLSSGCSKIPGPGPPIFMGWGQEWLMNN